MLLRPFLCLAILLLRSVVIQAQELGELTSQEFYSLPDDEQRTWLRAELTARSQAVSNVRVAYHVRSGNARRQLAGHWDPPDFVNRNEFEFSQTSCGNRIQIRAFPNRSPACLLEVWSHFNQDTGVARNLARHSQLTEVHARIAPDPDSMESQNHYAYWLSGTHHPACVAFSDQIVQAISNSENPFGDLCLSVAPDEAAPELIGLIVDLTGKGPGAGYREHNRYWLDPQQGLLVTRVHQERRMEVDGKCSMYNTTDFEVVESREFCGILMPSRATIVTLDTVADPDTRGVCELTVSALEVGSVKPESLSFDFPPGTIVNDMFRKVTYTAGHEQDAVPYDNLRDRRALSDWIVWANVAIAGLAVIWAYRRFGSRRRLSVE